MDILLLAAPQGASGAGQQSSSMFSLITFGLLFFVMYMFLIRPQSKKKKELQQKISNMKTKDEVVSIGGICGTVEKIEGEHVFVKVNKDMVIKFSKQAISTVVVKESKTSNTQGKTSSAMNKKSASKPPVKKEVGKANQSSKNKATPKKITASKTKKK